MVLHASVDLAFRLRGSRELPLFEWSMMVQTTGFEPAIFAVKMRRLSACLRLHI